MKGLIIKKHWLELIFQGKKIWEIRGSKTNFRGKIKLIESGSGKVVGECCLVDCISLNLEDYASNKKLHQIDDANVLPYKKTYAWVLSNAKKYEVPRPYKHPNGAIIWVDLDKC